VQGGDTTEKGRTLVPPYIAVGRFHLPFDILAIVMGILLILFGRDLASYLKTSMDLVLIGSYMFVLGILLLFLGRLKFE